VGQRTDGAATHGDKQNRSINPGDSLMHTHFKTSSVAVAATLAMAACGNMYQRDKNTATGAVIGGAAGAIITGGSTAGTVGGAAVGGVIGNQVDPKKK
jgi:osmotically inducible lipoprotein OsmB